MEKVGNNPRHSAVGDLGCLETLLASAGIRPDDIDVFSVDGWHRRPGQPEPALVLGCGGDRVTVPVAPYAEQPGSPVLRRYDFPGNQALAGYVSYHHVAGHILSAYCTSPFAQRAEDAYVLVWDGGMAARLYFVRAADLSVSMRGRVLPLLGSAFAEFAAQFPPFWRDPAEMTVSQARARQLE